MPLRLPPRGRAVWPGALTAIAIAAGLAGCGSGRPESAGTGGSAAATTAATTTAVTTTAATTAAGSPTSGRHTTSSATGTPPASTPARVTLPLRLRWSTSLGAAVYGRPVIAGNLVIAATERDTVAAVSLRSGRVVWTRTIGRPLSDVASVAGCGDIDPLGITGAPAIDRATGTVYVVGEVVGPGGAIHHQLVGLGIRTGAVRLSVGADPPAADQDPRFLLQRAALRFANGRVYIGYGGNFGDCGTYHGWLVAVDVNGQRPEVAYDVTPHGHGGAIWEPSGPAVDPTGDVYVSTGNPNPDSPQVDDSESVVKLSPTLTRLASFHSNAPGDEDLGSVGPLLLPGGRLFQIGKQHTGYILATDGLTETASVKDVCSGDADGGAAYDSNLHAVYVACRQGPMQEVDLANNTLGWHAPGVNGSPVLTGGRLFSAIWNTGTLVALDPASGRRLSSVGLGRSIPNFAQPATAGGLLVVGTDAGLVAAG